MRYRFARLLQLLGMLILPIAIAGNVAREDWIDLKTSLVMSAIGVALFYIGWQLQQGSRPG